MSVGDPAVAVSGLSFAYPGAEAALRDVSFAVPEGESVGLVGPNGAGKTTLFLCLAGVLPVRPGSVRLAGLDPGVPAERARLPSAVGVVFQQSDDQVFGPTVWDDVAFGPLNLRLPADEVRSRVAESLARVGLADAGGRVPHRLSGGEKRRVALAGVLAMRPRVLLLDEPSVYLDARGRRELIALLATLPGTLLVASHDLELVRAACRRVLVVDGGRVVADGSVDAVLSDDDLLERHGLR
jgi:cobalt/nickel transport system ATP-binding protein